jgi:hypothetical protein
MKEACVQVVPHSPTYFAMQKDRNRRKLREQSLRSGASVSKQSLILPEVGGALHWGNRVWSLVAVRRFHGASSSSLLFRHGGGSRVSTIHIWLANVCPGMVAAQPSKLKCGHADPKTNDRHATRRRVWPELLCSLGFLLFNPFGCGQRPCQFLPFKSKER